MKTFGGEFNRIIKMLDDKENFAISRFGDGEYAIINNDKIDLISKGNGEFKHDPASKDDEKYRKALIDSFKFKKKNYLVGIACQCCIGKEKFESMAKDSGQNEENLTFANIFVNSNYPDFKSTLIPLLAKRKVIVVCNSKGKTKSLPFKVQAAFYVGTNAWKNDYNLITKIKQYISSNKLKDVVFVVAAGPFANVLCHQLFEYNSDNTYIDIGSTLDPWLFGDKGKTRGYLRGADTLKKVCIWR
jgi:hypothetical protein